MANESEAKKIQDEQQQGSGIKPEPETLNTTDPQEEMEGPISSLVQDVKKGIENNGESKEEADEKKEKDM